jgi:hypothetical protein
MKNTARSSALHYLIGLACVAAPVAGCATDTPAPKPSDPGDPGEGSGSGSDPSQPPGAGLDPTGNWNLTYMFGAGCGQGPTTAPSTFTVTLGPQGYTVAIAGTTTTGTLICADDTCKLSAVFAWTDATGTQFQQSANIALDGTGTITGSGTESVTSTSMACTISFTVQGTKQ